jgi:hypothetical protein
MKKITLLFYCLLQINFALGQIKTVPVDGNHFLFTFKNDTYLLDNEYVYNLTSANNVKPNKHNLIIKEFNFVSDSNFGYLKNASSGIVYSFDGINFKRLDNSFDFKSQFRSFSFLHNNIIFDFGGYGLHSFKNIITYFNFAKKETELFNQVSSIKESPISRDRMIAEYKESALFIGPGHGINIDIENPYENASFINDYWKFSFLDKKWQKLGEGKINAIYPYDVVYNFNKHSLLISEKGIYEINIKDNLLISYPNANIDIVKSLNKKNSLSSITYNKAKDGFYIIIHNSMNSAKVLFVKKLDFLGSNKTVSKLYIKTKSNWIYFTFFIITLFVLSFLVYIYKSKKTLAKLINSKMDILSIELKNEDFMVLKKIIDSHPNYINYSELLDLFPEHLGYESKKKKIRKSIINLEDYISQKLKMKLPIFIYRKNIEDKREKQIKIR